MALKYKLDSLDDVDEPLRGLYAETESGFTLNVEGLDLVDPDKAINAIKMTRSERDKLKAENSELKRQHEETERKRMESQQEFEALYKKEKDAAAKIRDDYAQFQKKYVDEKRAFELSKITASVAKDETKRRLLEKELIGFVEFDEAEGKTRISGPDGTAWDAQKLSAYAKDAYPFLVDGPQSSGGGATGSSASGGGKVIKRSEFEAMSQVARAEFIKAGGRPTAPE